jgi:hypothetical protein
VMRRLLVLAGLVTALNALVLATPTNAQASKLRRLAANVTSFASDGLRWAAWQTRELSPLTVLDTRTGQKKTIALPSGCRLVGESSSFHPATGGRFLLECGTAASETTGEREGRIIDVRTDVSSPLPAGGSWFALGTRYAFGNAMEPEGYVVADLTTGAVTRVGEGEYRNLDLPGAPGPTAVCPKLRRAVKRNEAAAVLAYDNGLLARPAGEHGDIEIDRCNGSVTVLPGAVALGRRLGEPAYLDLLGGVLSWDTAAGESGPGEGTPGIARLDAYVVKTHRREEWKLPRLAAGLSTHTGSTVFWLSNLTYQKNCQSAACDAESWSVYSARL